MLSDWEKATHWWERVQGWGNSFEETHPYQCSVTFERGESASEQEEWLKKKLAAVGINRADVQHYAPHDVDICLAFKTFLEFAKFMLYTFGDKKRGHSFLDMDCAINFTDEVDPRWMRAAKCFLDAINASPEIEILDKQVLVKFEYFSQLAGFRLAVENGEIDALSTALERQEILRGKGHQANSKPSLKPFRSRPR